jgi:hypothetical protein
MAPDAPFVNDTRDLVGRLAALSSCLHRDLASDFRGVQSGLPVNCVPPVEIGRR